MSGLEDAQEDRIGIVWGWRPRSSRLGERSGCRPRRRRTGGFTATERQYKTRPSTQTPLVQDDDRPTSRAAASPGVAAPAWSASINLSFSPLAELPQQEEHETRRVRLCRGIVAPVEEQRRARRSDSVRRGEVGAQDLDRPLRVRVREQPRETRGDGADTARALSTTYAPGPATFTVLVARSSRSVRPSMTTGSLSVNASCNPGVITAAKSPSMSRR